MSSPGWRQPGVSPLVDFEGEWTWREQEVLIGAITDVEKKSAQTPPEALVEKPWLCYCKRFPEVSIYMAHRVGKSEVLYAYNVVELGFEILEFGMEAKAETEPFAA